MRLLMLLLCAWFTALPSNSAFADCLHYDSGAARPANDPDPSHECGGPGLGLGGVVTRGGATSLTTFFTGTNSFAGNTFDLTPTQALTIDSFSMHLGVAGAPATVAVYWRNGTAVGFEGSAAGWTLLGTANVISGGPGVATPVAIGGLALNAASTYGFYVDLQNYQNGVNNVRYTNGVPTTFSNADLSLTTGVGKGNPAFTGSTFLNRQWNGTVHYSISGGLSADLAATLSDSPDPVSAGSNLTYTATVLNTGPDPADDLSLTVNLPATTTLVSATGPGGLCTGAGPVTCTFAGSTSAGISQVATIVVTVPANTANGAILAATMTSTSNTADPDPADNNASAGTGVITRADLSINVTDTPDPVTAGTNLTYVATVANAGPSDAQDVSFTFALAAGTSLVSVMPSGGGICTGTTTLTCTYAGPTAPATNRSATIVVAVAADVPNGATLNATGIVSSATTDPNPANNEFDTPTGVAASADLSITLDDAADPVVAGTSFSYTATATNGGTSDAQGLTISLPLPAGTTFVSAVPSAGGACDNVVLCTWAGPTGPGGVRSVIITVAVASAQTASLSATATAGSSTTDPNPANNSDTETTGVQVVADLTVTLTDAPDPVTAGTQLTYTANITNIGPSDATGVTLSLPLPANTSFVSGSVAGGGNCSGSPVVMCTLTGSVVAGGARAVNITVLVAASTPTGSTISATVTVGAGSPDPNLGNNSASTTTGVITSADLVLSLTASAAQVDINVPITFTAVSQNNGPSDAQDVSISLTLTPDFRYAGHTAPGATCTTPQVGTTGVITCTWAGATAAGASRTLDVSATSNNQGSISVGASTTSTTPDPVANNNAASLSVTVGFVVQGIPSLSAYGLVLLGLLLGLFGMVAVRRVD